MSIHFLCTSVRRSRRCIVLSLFYTLFCQCHLRSVSVFCAFSLLLLLAGLRANMLYCHVFDCSRSSFCHVSRFLVVECEDCEQNEIKNNPFTPVLRHFQMVMSQVSKFTFSFYNLHFSWIFLLLFALDSGLCLSASCLFFNPSVRPSIYPSICISVCLSTCCLQYSGE